MSLLDWQNEYSVGIEKIDLEHQNIFKLINKLADEVQDKPDLGKIREILKELNDYSNNHLLTEENLFAEYQYPGAQSHIKIHDSYRAQVKEMLERQENIRPLEILDFLRNWWTSHIVSLDQGYAEFLRSHMK